MAFVLFLIVNAVLFVRPAELFPSLGEFPAYNYAIVATLVVAIPGLLRRLDPTILRDQPAAVCVLALLPAVVLSFPADQVLWGIESAGVEFLKIVLYFLLLTTVINTERRLKAFLVFLGVLITVSAALPLLHQRGTISLPSLEALEQKEVTDGGEQVAFPRLQSTGIFNDPNDFAMILVTGIVIGLYFLGNRDWGVGRVFWLLPIAICAYAFWLTRSRGGLLALLAAVIVLTHARWGLRRAVLAALVMLPVVAAGFAFRADAMEGGTGQARVLLWSDGLMGLRWHPILGIGYKTYAEQFGQVAHNSFVESYTELGLFGGTLFFGANAAALWMLYRVRRDPVLEDDVDRRRLLATVTGILVGSAVSQFSLSRAYAVTPYVAIGLAIVFVEVVPLARRFELPQFNLRFLTRLAAASFLFLAAIHLYVRFTARYS